MAIGEAPGDRRKANAVLLLRTCKDNPGNDRVVSLTSVAGKFVEHVLLEVTSEQKDQKVNRNIEVRFSTGKLCLTQ